MLGFMSPSSVSLRAILLSTVVMSHGKNADEGLEIEYLGSVANPGVMELS